jgi:4-diphosphocytidyl-2-C-methyl-D-erythritol kinase
MKLIRKLAYAKLNLDLHVLNKRKDGYHELKSIVIPLDFYDELYLEKYHENEVISNIKIENNLILKVIEEFQKRGYINEGVKVTLYKKVPLASGLGGGSADAAATINGIVELFNLNLPKNELEDIANQLGSDILFCLYNKPSLMMGRGDKIEFIDYPWFDKITLIFLPTKNNNNFDIQLSNYLDNNQENYINNINNDLLDSALKTNDIFKKYYEKIIKIAPNVKMTGSGPTLYLINSCENIKKRLKNTQNIQVFDVKIKK